MVANKRLTDLTDYLSVLPYASELFGVLSATYRLEIQAAAAPDHRVGGKAEQQAKLTALVGLFEGEGDVPFDADHQMVQGSVKVGEPRGPVLLPAGGSLLLAEVRQRLQDAGGRPQNEDWSHYIDENFLVDSLNGKVYEAYREEYTRRYRLGLGQPGFDLEALQADIVRRVMDESAVAGMLLTLVDKQRYAELESLFYASKIDKAALGPSLLGLAQNYDDPFATFDPKKDIKNVSLSPLGIVHLFRQYFFELDSFSARRRATCGSAPARPSS